MLLAKGAARGEAEGLMKCLNAFLTARYPGLESTRGIARLANQPAGEIERLFNAVVAASDRQAAQDAIKADPVDAYRRVSPRARIRLCRFVRSSPSARAACDTFQRA